LLRLFSVTIEYSINHIHSTYDPTEWRKTLFIQKCIFLSSVEEYLTCACSFARHCKRDRSALIAHFHGIVFNVPRSPLLLNLGISVNANLNNKVGNYPEETTSGSMIFP
jgi:hypothetical protein